MRARHATPANAAAIFIAEVLGFVSKWRDMKMVPQQNGLGSRMTGQAFYTGGLGLNGQRLGAIPKVHLFSLGLDQLGTMSLGTLTEVNPLLV